MADVGIWLCDSIEYFYVEEPRYIVTSSYYSLTTTGGYTVNIYNNITGSLYASYHSHTVSSRMTRTGEGASSYATEITNSEGTSVTCFSANDKYFIALITDFENEIVRNYSEGNTSDNFHQSDKYIIDVNGDKLQIGEQTVRDIEIFGMSGECHIRKTGNRPVYIYSIAIYESGESLPANILYGSYFNGKHSNRWFYEHEIFGEDYDKPLIKISDELYNKGLCGRLYADCALSISKKVVNV